MCGQKRKLTERELADITENLSEISSVSDLNSNDSTYYIDSEYDDSSYNEKMGNDSDNKNESDQENSEVDSEDKMDENDTDFWSSTKLSFARFTFSRCSNH